MLLEIMMKVRVKKKKKQEKNKIKNNSLIKGIILISVYFVISFVLEIINFKMLNFGFFPKNIIFNLSFWFIICGLLFLIPNNTARLVVESVLLALQIFINLVNATLISNTGLVFHWNQLSQSGNAAASLEIEMINFGLIFAYILIWSAFLVFAIILNKKFKNNFAFEFKKRMIVWLSCVLGLVSFGTSFVFIGNVVRNNTLKNAYAFAEDGGKVIKNGIYFKNATMRTMGTFGFYFHDFATLMSVSKKNSQSEIDSMKDKLSSGVVVNEDAFGIAKGNNLIYILLESFDSFALDPYNTPNLWKLFYGESSENALESIKWGYRFDSFYGLNYTNNSEYISLTGHTTEAKTFEQYYNKKGLSMPYSLPQLFKNAKYEHVNYFHGYSKEYYNRDDIYKELGFDNVYGLEDSIIENKSKQFGDWVRDSDYIASMIDEFIPSTGSFFSYYATISTHGPYDDSNSRFDKYETEYDKNIDKYKNFLNSQGFIFPEDEKTQNQLRQYKAAVMDTDLMIAAIFKQLSDKGILNNTTIILFSDHNCFYSDLNGKIKGIDTDDYSNIETNKIPMLIYNGNVMARSSNVFCNTYDLFPTICDMFGFDYNSYLSQGYSIFQTDKISKSIHVSFKHGIFNKDYYTEDLINIKQINEKPTMSLDDFKKYAYEFFIKQDIIEFVYRNHLYSD